MVLPERRIIRNAVHCRICKDVIESTDVHEFRTCACGNVSVDGGHAYIRRVYRTKAWDEVSEWSQDAPD